MRTFPVVIFSFCGSLLLLAACSGSSTPSGGAPSSGPSDAAAGSDGSPPSPGSDGAVPPSGSSDASADGSDGSDGGGSPLPGLDAGPITGLNGATYYVSASTGADTNPGTKASPWKTIQQAGAVVKPGDTVIVQAGTYDGPIFGWDRAPCTADPLCTVAGTSTNPILFQADPTAAAGSVIIAGKNAKNVTGFDLEPGCDYVVIEGFTVNNAGTLKNPAGSITKAGISISGCTGCKVIGNVVDGVSGIGGIFVDAVHDVLVSGNVARNVKGTGTHGHGMYVSGSSVNVQVVGNHIYSNAYIGLHVNGDVSEGLPGVVKNLLVSGNLIHDNGQNGINCDGIQDSVIENNVLYKNARNGIELYQIDAYGGSSGNQIVNNTIDQSSNPSGYAISIGACAYDNQGSQPTPAGCSTGADDTSTGNVAFNDILIGGAGATSTISSADLSTSTNITSMLPGLFVDAASGDYTLAAGGPGVGKGVASCSGHTAPVTPAGNYDIGAFAFVP